MLILSQTPDNNPDNIVTSHFDLNNGGWTLIGILIAIIVIVLVVAIVINYKKNNTIDKLKEFTKTKVSDDELNLLLKYRKLNSREKTIINDTLNTLDKNQPPK